MLYIITEDSNSGYEFWKIVFESYLKETEYKINAAAGSRSLRKTFNDTLENCQDSNDSILLIFDNIDDTSSINPGNLIGYCEASCREKGVCFYFSDFYCFESIFLSYKELLNMTSNCKQNIKNTVEYVNNAINKGYGYWESTDEIVDSFLDENGITANNREHFESELLSIATYTIGYGCFHIKKSTISNGKCWLNSCVDIQSTMNSHVYEKDCQGKCRFINKNMDTVRKLNDIFDNSILKESMISRMLGAEKNDKNIQ